MTIVFFSNNTVSFYLLNYERHAGGALEESLGDQQTAWGREKSRDFSDDVGSVSFLKRPRLHRGILYKLSIHERDSLKAFDNSLVHLL